VIVALALVFGVAAAAGVNMLLSARAGQRAETVAVVVAAADMPRYTTVSADMLKTRDYPKGGVPDGAVLKSDDVIDRVVDTPLFQDEPVLEKKLSAKGAGRGMAAVIPPGMRAVTIQTPSVAAGVAGFILPGNKVDVLLTVKGMSIGTADPTGGGSTTTLLQHVEILAVDQRVEAPSANKIDTKELRSVTLLVTPDQAAKLDLGQNTGTLHLSLRNPQDKEPLNTRPATLADLRFHQAPPLNEALKSFLESAAKVAAAQRAEREKAEREKAERERAERETAEKDRAQKEKAEKERTEKERAEKERRATPRIRTLRGTVAGEVVID
jgi:pilus assembly protein CpaB